MDGGLRARTAGRQFEVLHCPSPGSKTIMMNLYSGTTCPFSQRCRIVLYEKGMDFQIIDVDL
ncbi:MAG: glutathione S-transferase N-terminal domain-containing protein, partial [Burkholderiales bacterium]|nr:glutathione S-transferase N-terminal domain-containing protein [Burkholderiales bacterium]